MKILHCHVEGFGGIVNKDFDFNSALSSFVFENGYGKTTLAAFIKAMLYGLESYKKNSKGFEDRLHYAPFSGARFGGNLTLLFRGEEYKIERFFDVKSQTKDTLRVYKNGRETSDLTDDVGSFVFGFDKESFERLLFIRPDSEEYGATPGVKSKLNRFVSEGGEFSLAGELLESAKKKLKAARGNSGLISKERENRISLLSQIENLEKLSDNLDLVYKQKNEEAAKIEELECALKEKNDLKLKEQIYKGYVAIKENEEELSTKLRSLAAKYPVGIPSAEDISHLKTSVAKRELSLAAEAASSLSGESDERLITLSKKFGSNPPSAEEIETAERLLKKREQASLSLKMTANADGTLQDSRNLPAKEDLAPYKDMLSEYKRLCDEGEALIEADSGRKGRGIKKAPLLLGIAFAVISIPLLFIHAALLAASLGIGLALILLAIFANGNDGSVTIRIAQMKAQSRQTEEKIRIFLSKYGFYSENGVFYDFSKLEEAIANKESATALHEKSAIERAALIKEKEECECAVIEFLNKYGFFGDDIEQEFTSLKEKAAAYRLLISEKSRSDERNSQNRETIKACDEAIEAFSEKYRIPKSALTSQTAQIIEADVQSHKRLSKEIKAVQAKAIAYKTENKISDETQSFDGVDSTAIEQTLSERRQELVRLEHTVNEIEQKLSSLPEKQNELEACEEKIAEYENRYRLISLTHELLKKADDSMTEKYVGPVKKLFLEYLGELSEALGKSFFMDIDFNLKFEENGELRDERHLSTGQGALTSLCLKLALLRAAFDEEEPFVIMDDPFTSLDETHMKNAVNFIKKISKSTQIVYFSCHNSRKI